MSAPTVRVRGPGSDRWAVANDSHQRLFGDGGAFLPAPLVADRSVVRETRSRFVEVVTLTSGERVVVKRHPYPGWFRGLKRRLPRAPGRVEWSNGLRLQQLGVPCAEPLAYGRVAARGDEAAAEVLVTRFLDGARELRKLAEPGALPPGERSRLIDVLAALVRQLHTAGVCLLGPHMENFLGSRRGANWEITPIDLHTHGLGHRDLKGPNILVDVHGQLWLVDLDGLSFRRELGPGRVAHDIARLFRDLRATAGIDRDEELEFAQAYLSVNDMPPLDVPSLLELVDAQPRVRKQQPQRGSV